MPGAPCSHYSHRCCLGIIPPHYELPALFPAQVAPNRCTLVPELGSHHLSSQLSLCMAVVTPGLVSILSLLQPFEHHSNKNFSMWFISVLLITHRSATLSSVKPKQLSRTCFGATPVTPAGQTSLLHLKILAGANHPKLWVKHLPRSSENFN